MCDCVVAVVVVVVRVCVCVGVCDGGGLWVGIGGGGWVGARGGCCLLALRCRGGPGKVCSTLCPLLPAPPAAAAVAGKAVDLLEFVFTQLQKKVGIVTAVVEVRGEGVGAWGDDVRGRAS